MSDTCHLHVRRLAGTMALLGLGLGFFITPWLYAIVAFVGANLIQSSFTNVCPAEELLPACEG